MASELRRIFHLSDIHFGLETIVRSELEQRPMRWRSPDLTMRARHREFAAATQWINSLAAPVTVEVGNHDMPYFNLLERFLTPYKRFRGMKEKVEQELDLGSLAIVPLKTAVRMQPRLNWSKGWVLRPLSLDALPAGRGVGRRAPPPAGDGN